MLLTVSNSDGQMSWCEYCYCTATQTQVVEACVYTVHSSRKCWAWLGPLFSPIITVINHNFRKCRGSSKEQCRWGLLCPLSPCEEGKPVFYPRTISFSSLFGPSLQGTISFSNTELTNYLEATDCPKQSTLHLVFLPSDSSLIVSESF